MNPVMTVADTLTPQLLDALLEEHRRHAQLRLQRLWRYYRNDTVGQTVTADNALRRTLAQEVGLPPRLQPNPNADTANPRERVVENDIAWRIHAMVDFMFGKPVTIQSLAPDPHRADKLERFLRAVFHHNGGIRFLQDLALLGSIYGYVDILARYEPFPHPDAGPAGHVALDLIEAPRAVPLLDPDDYRRLDAYILHYTRTTHELTTPGFIQRVRSRVLPNTTDAPTQRRQQARTLLWTPQRFQAFTAQPDGSGRSLEADEPNTLARIPVVHIQNLPQPFAYAGLSEVEPLIPLQDELNTRLSDRANRVTLQSFKMYLGKGIEHFNERPVAPGQMWSTDNPDATIDEFGGDAATPSEDAHIIEVREAMDKTSAVTPVVAGVIRDKIGNLTSENALRVVLMGLLARTEKKRVTYGEGIERLCELVLQLADHHDLLPNTPEERRVRLDWPNPMPLSQREQLDNARIKLDIGVPQSQVLAELGYDDVPAH